MGQQFAVALLTDFTDCLGSTGCFAAGMVAGGRNYITGSNLCIAILTPGIAGMTCCTAGFRLGIPDLRIYVVGSIHIAIGLLTNFTDCLCSTGCCAAGMVAGSSNFLTGCNLLIAVLAVSIAGVTCFTTGCILSTPDFRFACMVGSIQFAVRYTAVFTDCYILTGSGAAIVGDLAGSCITEGTFIPVIGCISGILLLIGMGILCDIAVALLADCTDSCCDTGCGAAAMLCIFRIFSFCSTGCTDFPVALLIVSPGSEAVICL